MVPDPLGCLFQHLPFYPMLWAPWVPRCLRLLGELLSEVQMGWELAADGWAAAAHAVGLELGSSLGTSAVAVSSARPSEAAEDSLAPSTNLIYFLFFHFSSQPPSAAAGGAGGRWGRSPSAPQGLQRGPKGSSLLLTRL